jgi:HlyD family secretion protein
MQRKLLYASLAAVLVALLVWAFMPSPQEVEIATVTEGRFERTVQEDGKTRLRERYVVSAPLGGSVMRIHLKQGDSVQRGAVLATLLPATPALLDARSRAEQTARIGAAEAGVARARANIGRASAALEQARAELRRSETLAQQGFVSPNQNESGRLAVRLRDKELEAARQEEDAAGHELEQARIAAKQFTQQTSSTATPTTTAGNPQRTYSVLAPVAGKVLKVLQQSEGMVAPGTPLLELGDPSALEVVVDLLTEDAAQIAAGTAVQLSNWGGPQMLTGTVRLVEPAAFTKVSALGVEEQRVNAVIDITSPPSQWTALGDGYKVDVRVLVQVVDKATLVPVSALFPVGARSGLFVLDQGRAALRAVEVAARNGVHAWVKAGEKAGVKAGIAAGTQVIVYPDTKLRDGDKVKPR